MSSGSPSDRPPRPRVRRPSRAPAAQASGASGEACWICGTPGAAPWRARTLDHRLSPADLRITDMAYGATLALFRCSACGFVFADGDELAELTSLYARLEDPGYEATSEPRRLQMHALLRWTRAALPGARTLLDVGAGAGFLVAEAVRQGLDAVGVEPSASLAACARRRGGATVLQGTLPHAALDHRTFDVVTLVDVIEHVPDPVALLRACARHLAPGGAMLVVTPDVRSVAARLLGRRWWHYRPAHVGYFDRDTLTAAAVRAGLGPWAWMRPCWYFPVSYLAERLGAYLPLAMLNRVASRIALLRALYAQVIPLDLRDSRGVLLRPTVAR